jgi:hypothetical protein
MEIYKLRKQLWTKITNTNDFKFNNKIDVWYTENNDKVFKGENGFTFIKNEVFGSSEELFLSLHKALTQ